MVRYYTLYLHTLYLRHSLSLKLRTGLGLAGPSPGF